MRRALLSASVVGCVLAAAACEFPEFAYDDDSGAGAATSTTSTTTSTTSTGGAPPCLIGDLGACGDDMKCTVVDLVSGAVNCAAAGPKGWWERCNNDADCIEGAFCDPRLLVCKPFCTSLNDCVFEQGMFTGECLDLRDETNAIVPGNHRLCLPNCEPKTGAPCDVDNNVTCLYVGSGQFDCGRSQNETVGSSCTSALECQAGLLCVGPDNGATCRAWCTPVDQPSFDCPGNGNCDALNPSIDYKGVPHGACLP